MKKYDVVIIGSGIAGMSAAIYLKRNNKSVLVIENDTPGGQLNRSSLIENYPGYVSISGPDLACNIYNQVSNLNIDYYFGDIKKISFDKNTIYTDEEVIYKYLIIATGRSPRKLDILNDYIGNGVSYCAICDGTLYKDKIVCVVGGGNSALESAMYLSYICSKVYLIHRNDEYRAEGILVDKLLQKSNIECIKNARITELKETNDKLSSVVINNDKEIICDGIFIEIGNVPVPIKCDGLKLDDNYIVVDSSMKTSVDGVYACGDIIKKEVYQISTAVGEGTMAAVSIIRS